MKRFLIFVMFIFLCGPSFSLAGDLGGGGRVKGGDKEKLQISGLVLAPQIHLRSASTGE